MSLSALDQKEVLLCLKRKEKLPTLPTIFAELAHAASDPNTSLHDLAEIIACDPTLTANVLHIANSSFMGLKQRVLDLPTAVMCLGMYQIRRIALGVGSFNLFSVKGKSGNFVRRIWLHSLTTALVSEQIARLGRFSFADEAYLSGLLHDLGKIFFATSYTQVYAALREEVVAEKVDGLLLEKEIFGMTHLDVVTELCSHWRLPAQVEDVAKNHHHPLRASEENRLIAYCVAASNLLAHQVSEDEPRKDSATQIATWLTEMAAASEDKESLEPSLVEGVVMVELERAKCFEEVLHLL